MLRRLQFHLEEFNEKLRRLIPEAPMKYAPIKYATDLESDWAVTWDNGVVSFCCRTCATDAASYSFMPDWCAESAAVSVLLVHYDRKHAAPHKYYDRTATV